MWNLLTIQIFSIATHCSTRFLSSTASGQYNWLRVGARALQLVRVPNEFSDLSRFRDFRSKLRLGENYGKKLVVPKSAAIQPPSDQSTTIQPHLPPRIPLIPEAVGSSCVVEEPRKKPYTVAGKPPSIRPTSKYLLNKNHTALSKSQFAVRLGGKETFNTVTEVCEIEKSGLSHLLPGS